MFASEKDVFLWQKIFIKNSLALSVSENVRINNSFTAKVRKYNYSIFFNK